MSEALQDAVKRGESREKTENGPGRKKIKRRYYKRMKTVLLANEETDGSHSPHTDK